MSATQDPRVDDGTRRLSPAAYRELQPGETYVPFVRPEEKVPEFTPRAILLGALAALVFSMAATYSGLKVAQVMEAAIPIGIIAVGISGLFARRNSVLENVIIQSIGGASGLVVAGSIFTLPALYMMKVAPPPLWMIITTVIVAVLGAMLGLMFLIPLRRYFVSEQHGKLPFPEATAINEVFVTGEQGGQQAKLLMLGAAVGGAYDFVVTSVRAWAETVDFHFIGVMKTLADKYKAVLSLNAVSLILGLGYITGLRYSAIICAGGLFSTVVLVPLIFHFGQYVPAFAIPPAPLPKVPSFIPAMAANDVFKLYAQRVGVGAMAGAGIIGIIRSLPTIARAFSLGFQEIKRSKSGGSAVVRTDRDLKMNLVLGIIVTTLIAVAVFFYVLLSQDPVAAAKAPQITLVGLVMVFVFAFLFTTVAALATAMTGNNPISGMTLVTLIIGSTALVSVGLQGDYGKFAAIVMGGVVCTALSMSGGFVTDLKVGYWLGSTPRYQQLSKMIGMVVAAFGVAITVYIIHTGSGTTDPATGEFISGFMNTKEVPAPQANLFATILSGIFDQAPVTWLLYGVGLVLAVLLVMMGLPPLAFAIGMYLPLEINTPLFIGGLVSHYVQKSSKDPAVSEDRVRRGTVLASGLIAGAAIMGVVGVALKTFGAEIELSFVDNWPYTAQVISLVAFLALCVFVYKVATATKTAKG